MRNDFFLYAKFHVWCTKRDHLFRVPRKTSHQSEFSLLHILEVFGSCCGTKTSIVLNDWCTSHGFNDKGAKEIKLIYFCNCFINFLFKSFDNSNFLIMCNILVMCNLHMICKMPIFSYFTLKSNIHHFSNITLHIHIIKIYVNSNIFELIPIVHIICQKFIKTSYFIIFHHFP